VVLIRLIDLFTNLFYYGTPSFAHRIPADHHLGWWAVLIPAAGGLIIGLMARYGSERIRGHGIPEAMEAILIGKSRMQPKVAVLKPVSSAISIGSGGPFGAEGPIIMTGGSLGSLVAQAFHLTGAERKTLLVAGAAGGMSATFATPMAAVLLAVELLLFEWKPRSLIPVALASFVAALLRPMLMEPGPMFPVAAHAALPTSALLASGAVGLLAGLLAMLLTAAVYSAEDAFHRLPIHWMWWPTLGGLFVGIGGLIQPRALGVGYDIIEQLLNGHYIPSALVSLIVVKGLIWSVARRGYHITREYATDPLERLSVGEVMTADVVTIPASLPLRELVGGYFFAHGPRKHPGYPVVDREGRFLGVITRSALLDHWLGAMSDAPGGVAPLATSPIIAFDLIETPPVVTYPDESCREAAERMASAGVKRLPVVAADDPSRLVGIVVLGDLFKARQRIIEEEAKRERFFGRREIVGGMNPS
jgi:CBS domain-containing protein